MRIQPVAKALSSHSEASLVLMPSILIDRFQYSCTVISLYSLSSLMLEGQHSSLGCPLPAIFATKPIFAIVEVISPLLPYVSLGLVKLS